MWLKGSRENPRYSTHFIYLIAVIGALGGFLFGYDTGIIAGALIFIQETFVMSTLLKELVVSTIVLGALIGAATSGQLANIFGRRRMLIVASLVFLVGTALAALAPEPWTLIVARFIIGLAIGVSSYTAPLFISEMAPREKRGALVLLNGIAITGGEVVAFLVDYALIPTQSWRYMMATGLIPALLLLIGMLYVPSTPRWMALKGRLSNARTILRKIRGKHKIKEEFQEILHSLDQPKGQWKSIFARRIRPVLIVGLGLGILQQFVGINTVMYYGPFIFKAAGFEGAGTQILATLVMGVVNTAMTVVAVLIVDRVGRRPLLLGGTFAAMLSLAVITILFRLHLPQTLSHWLTIIFMMTYIAAYSLSLGSLFWLIISEIYPLNIRSLAMSFVTSVQWLANFIVAASFLTILNTIGPSYTFGLYGFMCFVAFLFSFFWVPETRGTSLEEIEDNLMLGKPSRELGKAHKILENT